MLKNIDSEVYRGLSVTEVLSRNGQEGYPRFGIGTKIGAKFLDLEKRIVVDNHPGLLFEIAADVNHGKSLRSIGREYGIDSKQLGWLLKLADISYPTRERAVQNLWKDPEFKVKNADAQKKRANPWENPDYRQRVTAINRAGLKKRWADPEFRARKTEEAKVRMGALQEDEEFRRKAQEARERTLSDPEFLIRHAQRMRDRWKDPSYGKKLADAQRAKMQDSLVRQQYIDRGSERLRTLWQNPKYRARQIIRSRERINAQRQDPDFIRKQAEAARLHLHNLWQIPSFRIERAEANQQLWSDPEFRKRIADASSQANRERWANDPEYRAKMLAVIKAARLDPKNRDRFVTPTIHGYRSDIDFHAQSAWEANIARIFMLIGREFEVGHQLELTVTNEYQDIFVSDTTEFSIDFLTRDNRSRIVAYEIMAHPFEDPDGWAKFTLAQEQFPDLHVSAITESDYERLQRLFKKRINDDPRFHGWETNGDNLRSNPGKYS